MNEFGKHLDEPREIGKKKQRISSKDKIVAKKQLGELLGVTPEQAKKIKKYNAKYSTFFSKIDQIMDFHYFRKSGSVLYSKLYKTW